MEKGECIMVIEEEEVRRDDPVEYFFPAGVGRLLSTRGDDGN